tara:strand:+ start:76 stop:477 length:402 start_codon:yes stop_codon:yes gene_type:complete
MTLIYKIVDNTDGRIYVGSTDQKIHRRMNGHKSPCNKCSSKQITDDNDYDVFIIEECDESIRKEREQYWMDNLICVNIHNTVWNEKEYKKEYYIRNLQHKKDYDKIRRVWMMSWCETKRDVCNMTFTKDGLFD